MRTSITQTRRGSSSGREGWDSWGWLQLHISFLEPLETRVRYGIPHVQCQVQCAGSASAVGRSRVPWTRYLNGARECMGGSAEQCPRFYWPHLAAASMLSRPDVADVQILLTFREPFLCGTLGKNSVWRLAVLFSARRRSHLVPTQCWGRAWLHIPQELDNHMLRWGTWQLPCLRLY